MRLPHDRPLAAPGLISYRYRSRWSFVMIGARDHCDALRQAARSIDETPHPLNLQIWDAALDRYVPVDQDAPNG